MNAIDLSYPTWYLGFCIALGALYAIFQYWRSTDFLDHPYLNLILAFLRGTTISAIAILLLNPLIRMIQEEIRPPVIIVAQDFSSSVGTKMSADEQEAYLKGIEGLSNNLQESYEVKTFSLGSTLADTLGTSFTEKETDLGAVFDIVNEEFTHLNVGAIILASDGLYNKGRSLLHMIPASCWILSPLTLKSGE